MVMCSRAECEKYIGQWIRFQTPWGQHVGMVERVTPHHAIIVSPRRYVPVGLATEEVNEPDLRKLDAALAWWGGGAPGYGYGYGPGLWARWAVAFLSIYLLWGLLW